MNEKELIKLVSKSLKIKANAKTSSENTPEWDSIGHLSILSAIDKYTKGKAEKIDLASSFSIKKLSAKLKKI